MKRTLNLKWICGIVCDLVVAGILLCVFAVFHHVIPKPGDTSGTVEIPKPAATGSAAANTPQAGGTQVITGNSYLSNRISIDIQTVQSGSGSTAVQYYLADIHIADVECLRTAFADGTYGRNYTQSVLEQDIENNAVLAISGDSYGLSNSGIVLRNGILYRYVESNSDICVLYYDGTMETLSPGEYDQVMLIERGAYQVWTFGPKLLDENGDPLQSFNTSGYLLQKHPRCAVGYYSPGHYVFVLADGRQEDSKGLSMQQLADLFAELGCKAAYNLDGGKSTVMTFQDAVYNSPYEAPRDVSDIIYIGE